ncbi:hypothetical protein, partial [Coprococcus eutactus]
MQAAIAALTALGVTSCNT